MSDSFIDNLELTSKPLLGRATPSDDHLGNNRDRLVDVLSQNWHQIGWILLHADSREKIQYAFGLVRAHSDNHIFSRLYHPTKCKAQARDIRKRRKEAEKAAKERFYAQQRCDVCVKDCREIEMAITQARPDQMEYVRQEFDRRRTACQCAQDQLRIASANEVTIENNLVDEESAFAQDQLLEFIAGKQYRRREKKYAIHPFNLANAIAGLPYERSLPFVGAWVSRDRSAKIETRFWPHTEYLVFKTIESIWNHPKREDASVKDFFRQQIAALPKRKKASLPQERIPGKRLVPNPVRQRLGDNFYLLERAIDRSLADAKNDERPMPYLIMAKFNAQMSGTRTFADDVMIRARKIP